jgi:hypothetical protein
MRAALAVLVLLALAGCGGDDALSRGEWAAQANAICLQTLKKVEALGRPATADDYLRVTPKANELGRDAIERLRDLKAPGAIEDDAGRMIKGYEDVVKLQDVVYRGVKAQREGKESDTNYFRAGNQALELGRDTDQIAKRLHADDCARDPWQAPSQT